MRRVTGSLVLQDLDPGNVPVALRARLRELRVNPRVRRASGLELCEELRSLDLPASFVIRDHVIPAGELDFECVDACERRVQVVSIAHGWPAHDVVFSNRLPG